jgi:hypothetical protein
VTENIVVIVFRIRTIDLYPNGDDAYNIFLTINLKATLTANMSEGWSRDVKFKLLVFNQVDADKTIMMKYQSKYVNYRIRRDCSESNASNWCHTKVNLQLNKLGGSFLGFRLKKINGKKIWLSFKMRRRLDLFGSSNHYFLGYFMRVNKLQT